MATTISLNDVVIARAAAALYGTQLGSYSMATAINAANTTNGGVDAVINAVYGRDFGSASHATVAAMVVANLGITGALATEATAVVLNTLNAAPAGGEGAAVAKLMNQFAGMSSDSNAAVAAAATAFNTKIAAATTYARTNSDDIAFGTTPAALPVGGFSVGQDTINGTAGNDVFLARIIDNSNTLQSGDVISGGAGDNDTLQADIGNSQNFAITAETTSVETVSIRTQANQGDSGQNNPAGAVQIDAQRMVDVTQWESNNSRADLLIEDVRIRADQITSDITIAMVETDPGHVDYGVYFDQYSLRNQVSNTSSINLKIMDTVAAAAGKAPLLNSNYGAFTFTYTQGGQSQVVTLKSDAIQNAQTYVELRDAFQAALDAEFGAGNATATVGENFTVVDPDSKISVTGQTIVLTTKTAATYSTPAGSGWLADGTAPPASNFYTNYTTGATSSTSLVTSKVILDDVGRGSTGGDLVIGGLSVGQTSGSQGVQKFLIEVRDNSKLETINSTNNTLREVVIHNGVTTSSDTAYTTTVKDAGDLTVNGNSGSNGANVTNGGSTDSHSGKNTDLPGASNQQVNGFGFSDVRVIDASAMTGNLAFSAEITSRSIGKYLNLKDIQALPAGDNVAFEYTGGTVGDTMFVAIDPTVAASRNTIVPGREDFTFSAKGGTGDDNIKVFVSPLIGGDQAWYTNQKLNKNITIDGGDGKDTITKPGAGDAIILGGTGDDAIYADNTGAQGATAGTDSTAGAVYTAAEIAQLQAVLALASTSNNTNDTGAIVNVLAPNPLGGSSTTVAQLDLINLLTPISFTDPAVPANPNPLLPTRAAIEGQINAAFTAGALTAAQKLALINAYHTSTAGTLTTPTTLVPVDVTGLVADGTVLSATDFAAGNALLDTYITAAKAALATAAGSDAALAAQLALLTGTQQAVVTATIAVNGAFSAEVGSIKGSAVQLADLNALNAALGMGATDAQVVAALSTAVANGTVTGVEAAALYAAAGGGTGAISTAAEVFDVQVIMAPKLAAAATTNTTATTALATAIRNNDSAVRSSASGVGADPVQALNVLDANVSGSTESSDAADAAQTALDALNNGALKTATTVQTDLAALKGALAVGTSDLNVSLIIAAAVAKGTITGPQGTALQNLDFLGAPLIAGTINATEKEAMDKYIQALQEPNTATVAALQIEAATLQATVDYASDVAAKSAAAAAASPAAGTLATYDKAVFVFNTANQTNVSTVVGGTGYVLASNDERSVADLKSDTNNSYNFYNATLTVNFKGIEQAATVTVPSTGYKTSDLQVNQAIKQAINSDAVLSKLLVATDGPANTLVVTSLIDGVHSNADLSVSLAVPTASLAELSLAASAYGVSATDAAVAAVMTAALASLNTKGDYVDQLAETGAFGGNAQVTGADSITTSDNTITGGDNNDVIVLGTTTGITTLLSSNDTVVFGANFGNDTVVHFQAGALVSGGDMLKLSGLGGSILSAANNVDKSVTVADLVPATNGTEALVAAFYADSSSAQTHVYVAVNAHNIGSVYAVTDAAGTGAGSVTATFAGTIDLADTLWASLTTANFV